MRSRLKMAPTAGSAWTYLEQSTRDLHDPLEQQLQAGARRSTRSDLVQYLLCMEPWIAYADHLVWNRLHREDVQAQRRQQKSFWIRRDLHRLGVTEVLSLPEPLATGSDEQLLGLGYVLESATLGSRTLRKRFTDDPDGPFLFLEGYGSETRDMWDGFLSYLEEGLRDEDQRRAAAGAARSALVHLTAWLQSKGVAK